MIKKSLNINQNFATENDEDDDIEELDDSFYTSDSEESDSNKNENYTYNYNNSLIKTFRSRKFW